MIYAFLQLLCRAWKDTEGSGHKFASRTSRIQARKVVQWPDIHTEANLEKVTAWQKPVMVNFIDFRKAFDCIHRPSLWSILRQYGIQEEIVNIIQNLYEDSKSNVKINGISGEWFEVVTGVRQGCVLSPLLFAICVGLGDEKITEKS